MRRFFLLADKFANAKWLTAEERAVLESDQAEDAANKPKAVSDSLGEVFKNPAIWAFGLIYFCIQSGGLRHQLWLPSIIKNLGFSDNLVIGWLSAIPYLLAAVFMLLVGRSADLRKERRWHLVVPMLMGAIGLLIAVNFATSPAIAILGLTIATMGALTGLPMFWPVPTALAQRRRGRRWPGTDQLHGPDWPGSSARTWWVGVQGRQRLHRCGPVCAGRGDRRRQPAGPAHDPYLAGGVKRRE